MTDNARAHDAAAARMFIDLLGATHLTRPDDVAVALAEKASAIGAQNLVIYLIDYEETDLIPVPSPYVGDRGVLRVEGTIGGRVFSSTTIHETDAKPSGRRLWLPLLDGTDRLGVLEMTFPAGGDGLDPAVVRTCERYAHLAAQMILSKGFYGDVFELVRRRQPMSVGAELQYKLLPPSVFATGGFVLAGALEPAYNAGGDSFDYALNGSVAHMAVFDAMGHGLSAAVTANVAVSAYRNSRRRLLDLPGTYAAVDEALVGEFGGERYATALLARLDVDTGSFSWLSAGHLPPLLLRGGKLIKTLDTEASTPLGVPFGGVPESMGHESLEPGDRVLLYTDGLTEARTTDGEFFTAERLAEFLERQAAAGLPAPETLRRLRHAILSHHDVRLQDDATALLIEWRHNTERALLPQTV